MNHAVTLNQIQAAPSPGGCTCRDYGTHITTDRQCPIHGEAAHRARLARAAKLYAQRENGRVSA